MASVRTLPLFEREIEYAPADEPDGCSCGREHIPYFQPKGDPLTELLALEQRALEDGFANVHEYIEYIKLTQY